MSIVKVRWLPALLVIAKAVFAQDVPISEPALVAANGSQGSPSVAGSGNDFFAAWTDARAETLNTFSNPVSQVDIYGSRIWIDGRPDPAGGVPMSPTPFPDESPNVVWNGSDYVVINIASRPLSYADRGNGLMFTRVRDAGPEPGVFIRFPQNASASSIAAAWNGREYLVAIVLDNLVRGLIVDAEFRSTQLFDISDQSSITSDPAVATNGDSFLVSWIEDRVYQVHTALVTSSGETIRPNEPLAYLSPLVERAPAPAAWNGHQYLVTWTDSANVLGRFVDDHGAAASDFFIIAPATDAVSVYPPSIAWNGSEFLLAFSSYATRERVGRLFATRLREDGAVVESPRVLAQSTGMRISIAASGSHFVVVYVANGDIHSIPVDGTQATVEQLVSKSLALQSQGAAAFDGDRFGFIWNEGSNVMFGRTSIEGQPLDGAGLMIGQGAARAIVSNGNSFLAVWQPGSFTFPSLPPLRAQLDQKTLDLPEGGDLFASDGHSFLVVTRQVVLSVGYQLATYLIDGDGTVAESERLEGAQFDQIPVSIAWNGSRYLLVYTQYLGENCYKCFPPQESRAIFLDRDGRPMGRSFPVPIAGPIAGSPGRFLIAGPRYNTSPRPTDLVVNFVDDNGLITPPIALAAAPYFTLIDAAWTGTEFVVAGSRSVFHVDRNGIVTSVDTNAIPADAITARFVVARGRAQMLIWRVVKLLPGVYEAGIARYFVHWFNPPRTRAVR